WQVTFLEIYEKGEDSEGALIPSLATAHDERALPSRRRWPCRRGSRTRSEAVQAQEVRRQEHEPFLLSGRSLPQRSSAPAQRVRWERPRRSTQSGPARSLVKVRARRRGQGSNRSRGRRAPPLRTPSPRFAKPWSVPRRAP